MNYPKFGLLTNPSIEILNEIKSIHRLQFDYVEIGIEGPEGHPFVIDDKQNEIIKLLYKFKEKPIGHTVPWIDLGSDYEYVRQAWISEAIKEIKIAKQIGITMINFHANANGMYFGEKRKKIILNNWIKSLQEIIAYGRKLEMHIMLENLPASSNRIHKIDEFKYIINNVSDLNVHLDIPHAFTSGGMPAVVDYIRAFGDKISHIHWHDNHGKYDEHLPIGEGLIDHGRIVEELKDINYCKTITLEIFTNKKDAKSSAEKLKELWMMVKS